jgi:hypothetical protein
MENEVFGLARENKEMAPQEKSDDEEEIALHPSREEAFAN